MRHIPENELFGLLMEQDPVKSARAWIGIFEDVLEEARNSASLYGEGARSIVRAAENRLFEIETRVDAAAAAIEDRDLLDRDLAALPALLELLERDPCLDSLGEARG